MRPRRLGAVLAAGMVLALGGTVTYTCACTVPDFGGGGGGGQWAGTFDDYGADGPGYSAASCTTTTSNNAAGAIASLITSASGGDVICLNAAGSPYPKITTTASKSSDVTIQATPGQTVSVSGIAATGANHLVFQGLWFDTGSGDGVVLIGVRNFTIRYSSFYIDGLALCQSTTSCGEHTTGVSNANVLIDHDRFDNINDSLVSEGRVQVSGSGSGDTGFTITNSHFGGTGCNPTSGDWTCTKASRSGGSGGCTDGVQIQDDPTGLVIGPGNEFEDLPQVPGAGNCSDFPSGGAHVDSIQPFFDNGAVTVTGNWFHNVQDMLQTGPITDWVVTNNVLDDCLTEGGPMDVDINSMHDGLVSHNYFGNHGVGHCDVGIRDTISNDPPTNVTIRDNVFSTTSSLTLNSGCCTGLVTYNLNPGVAGTGNITGTPVLFSSSASSYYDYVLDAASPGYHAASDGQSMGIYDNS